MKDKIKTDSNDTADSDSDSDSSSTDSDTQTITAQSSLTGDTASSPHETTERGNKPRVAESDDDDTSSSDSSTEDGDVTRHTPSGDNTRSHRTAIETSQPQTSTEEVALRQNSTTAHDQSMVAKKEAARLSARLGHMSIVDSVVVRKKFRDRLSQNQLYTEIGNLVTDNTDEVGTEKEDTPQLTNNDGTKPITSQSPQEDSESSKSNDGEEKSNKSGSDDESDQEERPESGKPAKVEVSRKVNSEATSDLEEVELDNMAELRDDTATDDSESGVLCTCCCFRRTRKS